MSLKKSSLVAIREPNSNDVNFIMATFLRGLYFGDSWFKEIPKRVFMENYHAFIQKLLTSPGVKVAVACLQDDPESILGYCIYKEDKIHWVFVKSAWRNIGIAKSLIPTNATTVTHLTKVGLSIIRKHPQLKFNPFALN